jgi:hypothetical protein
MLLWTVSMMPIAIFNFCHLELCICNKGKNYRGKETTFYKRNVAVMKGFTHLGKLNYSVSYHKVL